ncbi:MAG: GDSL-type esterase/lipase family protein [Lachnospiraceae bacterium]
MRIKADCKELVYSGRIDDSDPCAPVFVFPCTSVTMRFTGNVLKAFVKNRRCYWNNYLGCVLDGEQTSIALPEEGEMILHIPVKSREREEHEVMLFKRQDSCHELTFCGFEIAEGARILPVREKNGRRIEVYGDSVSAGEVSEAVDFTGKEDPVHNGEYSNSWYSYAWMTARKLGAEIHDIAQGGIALMDGTGWFLEPEAVGMETAWNKVHYNPFFGEASEWDFSRYTPQVVIVAIGQNDSHPEDIMKEDYYGEKAQQWRKHYRQLLSRLRTQYPDAQIICCTTLLNHDEAWDRSIDQVCRELGDSGVSHYVFEENGRGTPGHLRIAEAEKMAEELAAYIGTLQIKGW